MEEIEIFSWVTLDAIKKQAEIVETVGDLQSGHGKATFCKIEDDYMELCYSDTASNYLRRYEDKLEFEMALEKRKEEFGDAPFDEDSGFDEELEAEESEGDYGSEEDLEKL